MSLFQLKSAPFVLLEDDGNKNVLPLVMALVENEKNKLNLFCYEQPKQLWKNIFKEKSNVECYDEFKPSQFDAYTSAKCSVVIDSVIQMSLCLGWRECLKWLQKLHNNTNVTQVLIILHKDCLLHFSKMQLQLNHIASAVISFDTVTEPCKIRVQLKKSGKLVKTEEILAYDTRTSTLRSTLVVKADKKEEPDAPLPGNLSTFKIEVEQTEKLEKYKLQLPYMSKINEGESKVYYEPDAVDDWDEEDPDEDLDL